MKTNIRRLDSLTHNDTAATKLINDNFEALQQGIEDALSRSGKTPNFMDAPLDMNMNRIINIADPVDDYDLANKHYVDTTAASLSDAIAAERARAILAEQGLAQNISDEETRAKAAEKAISDTLDTYGDIVTHDADEFATASQGAKADTALQPDDLGNATLTIKKNSTAVGTFTANSKTDTDINLVIPTTAADVSALPDSTKYAANVSLSLDSTTYVLTIQLKDQDGSNLGTAVTVDLPLESVIVSGSYDSTTKSIILVLDSGDTITIPVGDLVSGLQNEITSDNKLDADLVDDSTSTNKFVTASEKTTWNGKQDVLTFDSTPTQNSTNPVTSGGLYTKFGTKQDTLVSGTNIKTINGTTVLGSGNFTLADQSLSNLSAAGQMIIDSQNGTISNCILEIPQNINLTLDNNVLTLKAGSTIVLTGSTYSTYTLSTDRTVNYNYGQDGNKYLIVCQSNGHFRGLRTINMYKSGNSSSFPSNPSNNDVYFNTDDKKMYLYFSGSWSEWDCSYPICILENKNGTMYFAKFSDGRDCVFNGLGFVGQTKFIYPGVKVLEPIGKNADGTLKSREYTNNSLQLVTQSDTINRKMYLNADLFQITINPWYYDENTNFWYSQDNNPFVNGCVYLGDCYTVNDIVTDFTIRQPYEGARNLLTDDIKEQIGDIDTILHNINSGS